MRVRHAKPTRQRLAVPADPCFGVRARRHTYGSAWRGAVEQRAEGGFEPDEIEQGAAFFEVSG